MKGIYAFRGEHEIYKKIKKKNIYSYSNVNWNYNYFGWI